MPTASLDELSMNTTTPLAFAPARSDSFTPDTAGAPAFARWKMVKEDDLEEDEFLDDDNQDDDFLEDDDDDDDFMDDDDEDDDDDDFLDDDDEEELISDDDED